MNECFQVDIPPNRYKQMYDLVQTKGKQAIKEFPVVEGVHRVK